MTDLRTISAYGYAGGATLARPADLEQAFPLSIERDASLAENAAAPVPDRDRRDIAMARSGDHNAISRLYASHAPMVRAVLLASCTPADADDLVQEVFLRAMRRLGSLREDAAVGPWLAAIARREAVSWRRSIARRWRLFMRASRDARICSEPARRAAMEADDVLAIIRRLPEEYREVLIMRLVEQQSGPQIAAWTGRSHAAVRVALHRGMALLREQINAEVVR